MRGVDLLALAIGVIALSRLLGAEPEGDPFERRAAAISTDVQHRGQHTLNRHDHDMPERRSGPGLKGSLAW